MTNATGNCRERCEALSVAAPSILQNCSRLFFGRDLRLFPFRVSFVTCSRAHSLCLISLVLTTSLSSSLLSTDDRHQRGFSKEARPRFITTPPSLRNGFVRESEQS